MYTKFVIDYFKRYSVLTTFCLFRIMTVVSPCNSVALPCSPVILDKNLQMSFIIFVDTYAMNRSLRVIILVLAVSTMLFLTLMNSGHVTFREVHTSTTHEVNGVTSEKSRRRYSAPDDISYLVYSIGNQSFSNNQQIVDYIRSHISEPSLIRQRQLKRPHIKDRSQAGQAKFVDKLLSGRRNGFFVECGAYNGEKFSNTLFFELQRNWTGLLIEANPDYHHMLLHKNRRAYVLNSCLSTERRPMTVRYRRRGTLSGIVDSTQTKPTFLGKKTGRDITVNCFSLNSIMEALGVSYVDYFSLDVEGPEREILHTVNWTRLHIDVITIEYRILRSEYVIDKPATLKKLNSLRQVFRHTGIYHEAGRLPGGDETRGLDVVFSRLK